MAALGAVYRELGRLDEALHHYEAARQIAVEVGDRWGEGIALTGLGATGCDLGEYTTAAAYLRRSAAISREIGDGWVEGLAKLL